MKAANSGSCVVTSAPAAISPRTIAGETLASSARPATLRASPSSATANARARAANAHAAIAPGEQPSVAQAHAAIDKAQLDLSRTEVRAPMDGVVENADNLQVGQMAVTGLGMLSLVHSQNAWVEANFKEKDVGRMHSGERATVAVDAYPGQKFDAHIQSKGGVGK